MSKSFYINLEDKGSLEQYLRQQNWLKSDEHIVKVERAGEGNMNLVLRVITNEQSFIVKQAHPWVEKYPHIEAPQERALVEAKFYELTQHSQFLQSLSPGLLGKDVENFVLCLEDLGISSDKTSLYKQGGFIEQEELLTLTRYLSELHKQTVNERIQNREMRKLNHFHIFVFPFEQESGFNLDTIQPGLQDIALQFKNNFVLKRSILALGETYLADGDTLLHGDYYPGSWLNTMDGMKVIDPEFCFFGPCEFDLGVMIAHLKLSMQSPDAIQFVLENYSGSFDKKLMFGFAGVEIMRRLLGVAQLPLNLSLIEKEQLLDDAFNLVMLPEFNFISST
ncbi:MAG: hypothetical protein SH857_17495 [Chitinophagales bacterium]|nr:hypothetical protein [Chitinophagales bacterium]